MAANESHFLARFVTPTNGVECSTVDSEESVSYYKDIEIETYIRVKCFVIGARAGATPVLIQLRGPGFTNTLSWKPVVLNVRVL